jgi:hypothetical protein
LIIAALLLGWSAATAPAVAEETLLKGQYSTLQFTNTAGWVMQYDLYLPAAYTPAAKLPLLVMMHGLGPPDPVKRKKGWGLPFLKMNAAYNETNHAAIICEPVANRKRHTSRRANTPSGTRPGKHRA